MREVYLDSLFIANALSDYILLRLSGKVMGEQPNRLRLVGASLIGAGYACAVFFLPYYGILGMVVHFLILAMLCTVAFRPKGMRKMLKMSTVTFFCAAAMGGGMAGLSYLMQGDLVHRSGIFYLEIPPDQLLIFFVLIYGCVRLSMRLVVRIQKGFHQTVPLSIALGERHFEVEALIDTGNRLCDPITGKRVIVCDPSLFQDYPFEKLAEDYPEAVRILPIVTAGGTGSLHAFRPDYIEVERGKKRRQDLLVAIAANALCGDYSAVAGCELLEGEMS